MINHFLFYLSYWPSSEWLHKTFTTSSGVLHPYSWTWLSVRCYEWRSEFHYYPWLYASLHHVQIHGSFAYLISPWGSGEMGISKWAMYLVLLLALHRGDFICHLMHTSSWNKEALFSPIPHCNGVSCIITGGLLQCCCIILKNR